jgi:hypothetical protein
MCCAAAGEADSADRIAAVPKNLNLIMDALPGTDPRRLVQVLGEQDWLFRLGIPEARITVWR